MEKITVKTYVFYENISSLKWSIFKLKLYLNVFEWTCFILETKLLNFKGFKS